MRFLPWTHSSLNSLNTLCLTLNQIQYMTQCLHCETHLEAECDIDLSAADRVLASYEQGFVSGF